MIVGSELSGATTSIHLWSRVACTQALHGLRTRDGAAAATGGEGRGGERQTARHERHSDIKEATRRRQPSAEEATKAVICRKLRLNAKSCRQGPDAASCLRNNGHVPPTAALIPTRRRSRILRPCIYVHRLHTVDLPLTLTGDEIVARVASCLPCWQPSSARKGRVVSSVRPRVRKRYSCSCY